MGIEDSPQYLPKRSSDQAESAGRKKKPAKKQRTWVLTLALLAGMACLLYPVVATSLNNYSQSRLASQVWNNSASGENPAYAENLKRADDYNLKLAFNPDNDPFTSESEIKPESYRDYMSQLNVDDVMGTITIPKINVLLPIYHGTGNKELANGVGHLFGTSLPVGGANTTSVLTGHSGMSSATMFDNLREMEINDPIYLVVSGRKMKYKVIETKVITPDQVSELKIVNNKDRLILVTCTPYGINSHRLLVIGERAELDPVDEEIFSKAPLVNPFQSWMLISLAVAFACLCGYFLLLFWLKRRRKKNTEETSAGKRVAAPDDEDVTPPTD